MYDSAADRIAQPLSRQLVQEPWRRRLFGTLRVWPAHEAASVESKSRIREGCERQFSSNKGALPGSSVPRSSGRAPLPKRPASCSEALDTATTLSGILYCAWGDIEHESANSMHRRTNC